MTDQRDEPQVRRWSGIDITQAGYDTYERGHPTEPFVSTDGRSAPSFVLASDYDALRADRDRWQEDSMQQAAAINRLAEAAEDRNKADAIRQTEIIDPLRAELTALKRLVAEIEPKEIELRTQRDALAEALRQAHKDMIGVNVFVTSKERIHRPDGEKWWSDAIDAVSDALAQSSKGGGT